MAVEREPSHLRDFSAAEEVPREQTVERQRSLEIEKDAERASGEEISAQGQVRRPRVPQVSTLVSVGHRGTQ